MDDPLSAGVKKLTLEEVNREVARKRKALDKEIEKFMASKDAEFKEFEKNLRSQLVQVTVVQRSPPGKHSSTIVERGFSVAAPFRASIRDTKASKIEQDESESPRIMPPSPVGGDDDEAQIKHQPLIKQTSNHVNHASGVEIFDPEYLQEDYRKALPTVEPRMSTSLTTESYTLDNERPTISDRRLSSSPAGTGRSQRKSSLKRPLIGEMARERKHVLFSIDNQVIAPSSSPSVIRSLPVRNPPIPFSGLRDLAPEDMLILSPDDIVPRPSTQTLPPVSYAKSYKDLVLPTVIMSPKELEQEELHLETKDPLFDTDELLNDELEWESPVETKSEDEQEILSTSPHVGSLPIQIRVSSGRQALRTG